MVLRYCKVFPSGRRCRAVEVTHTSHFPISFYLSGRQIWGLFIPEGLCAWGSMACSGHAHCLPDSQIRHLIPREGTQRQRRRVLHGPRGPDMVPYQAHWQVKMGGGTELRTI